MIRLLGAAVALSLAASPVTPAAAAAPVRFDDAASRQLTLDGSGPRVSYRDGHGREVVLRGFNVSGEVKLNGAVHGVPAAGSGAPIESTADSRLLLNAPQEPGTVHYALIANGPDAPSRDQLAAAGAELDRWAAGLRR